MKGTREHFFGRETEGFDSEICDDLPDEAGDMELNQCLVDDVIDYCDSVELDEDTSAVVCVTAHNLFQQVRLKSTHDEEKYKKSYSIDGTIHVYENGELTGEGEFRPTSDGTMDNEEMRERLPKVVSSIDPEEAVEETKIYSR